MEPVVVLCRRETTADDEVASACPLHRLQEIT